MTPQQSRIADGSIRAIRALPIRDVVAPYVTLRTSGPNAKGLCPLHDEKTPSFSVRTSTNTWHCFGCGEGGDTIDLIMKIEGLDFPDASRHLAALGGIALAEEDDPAGAAQERTHRTRVAAAVTAAEEFYGEHLGSSHTDATYARQWLASRGFHPKAVFDTFRVGLSPRARDALCRHLRNRGFSPDEMVDGGLARRGEGDTLRDVFTGRLMWPVRDNAGATIGFGARRIFDNDRHPAKFVNTQETVLYHKSKSLFGIDLARKAIAAQHHVIVVEGYTDVVALHAAGYLNTVATCGTACTPDHIATLRRMIGPEGEITFGFDPDTAGMKAAVRAYELVKAGPVRATTLAPETGDPAEVYARDGNGGIRRIVEERTPLLRLVIDSHLAAAPLDTEEDKVATARSLASVLRNVPDNYLRDQYTRYAAGRLSLPLTYVADTVGAPTAPSPLGRRTTSGTESTTSWETECLRVLAQSHAAAAEWAPVADGMFSTVNAERVLTIVREALDTFTHVTTWPVHLAATCPPDATSLIAWLLATPLDPGIVDEVGYAEEVFTRLHEQRALDKVQALTGQLQAATGTDVERISAALARAQEQLQLIQQGAM